MSCFALLSVRYLPFLVKFIKDLIQHFEDDHYKIYYDFIETTDWITPLKELMLMGSIVNFGSLVILSIALIKIKRWI